jgi:hypothetical protein
MANQPKPASNPPGDMPHTKHARAHINRLSNMIPSPINIKSETDNTTIPSGGLFPGGSMGPENV